MQIGAATLLKAFGLCAENIEAQTLALIDKTKG